MKRTCKQCGKEFELTESEISFYESKGLDLPKRCKECREVNKSGKSASDAKRESLTTNKTASQAGWPAGKLIVTSIAAIAIVLAALIGGGALGGIAPGTDLSNTTNSSVVANISNATDASNTANAAAASAANTTDAAASAANTANDSNTSTANTKKYTFRNKNLLNEHYEKHGKDMGFTDAAAYESAASAVATNTKALHKTEKEDGDDVYYLENTREFVVVSTDGYIRTYYYADKDYFERQ